MSPYKPGKETAEFIADVFCFAMDSLSSAQDLATLDAAEVLRRKQVAHTTLGADPNVITCIQNMLDAIVISVEEFRALLEINQNEKGIKSNNQLENLINRRFPRDDLPEEARSIAMLMNWYRWMGGSFAGVPIDQLPIEYVEASVTPSVSAVHSLVAHMMVDLV